MKILLDECTPHVLKKLLTGFEIKTVQDQGWSGITNGALLRLAEGQFDVFITSDQNLKYQQNLSETTSYNSTANEPGSFSCKTCA